MMRSHCLCPFSSCECFRIFSIRILLTRISDNTNQLIMNIVGLKKASAFSYDALCAARAEFEAIGDVSDFRDAEAGGSGMGEPELTWRD